MTPRSSWVSIAASLVLLPAITGCVFQKKVVLPPVAVAPDPEPAAAPLYTSELTQTDQSLPNLPAAPLPAAQPAPPPESEVKSVRSRPTHRMRGRRSESEVAEREPKEASAREKESAPSAPDSGSSAEGGPGAPVTAQSVAKVTAKAPAGDTSVATPIGQLTAGASQDGTQSRRQAAELIQSTEHGVQSLRRALSGEQSKTLAQIRSFLQQAQHALHNGDTDGAFTLATKAKVLLAELTDSE